MSCVLCHGTLLRDAFEEVVFAGVGEPLLRWSVVKEVRPALYVYRVAKCHFDGEIYCKKYGVELREVDWATHL